LEAELGLFESKDARAIQETIDSAEQPVATVAGD
jgi:hypothetical protein